MSGSDPDLSKVTVGVWLPRWLALQVQLKPTTKVRYDVVMRRQVLPHWKHVPLANVTYSGVCGWVEELSSEGLNPSTVRKAHLVLSLSLKAAVKDGRLVRNVAADVPSPGSSPSPSATSRTARRTPSPRRARPTSR